VGLQTKQREKSAKLGVKSAKPRPASPRLIALLWVLVAIKVFGWQIAYWLASAAEIGYIVVALCLVFTRSRANRINRGIVLAYEVGTYLLNVALGKFGISVPHG
jgi:hypothetical protein